MFFLRFILTLHQLFPFNSVIGTLICEWWTGKYLDGIGLGLFVILLCHLAAGTEEDQEILESRWSTSRLKFKPPSHYSMTAITLTENFWPLVTHCVLVVIQREKNCRSFYKQHHNSFHLLSFRLSVVCALSYTDVVVHLSTGKMDFNVKLHVLIGCGEKRDPKLVQFLYCVCNYAALGHLYIYVFVVFSYFDLWCETYKLINWNELQ